MPLYHPFLLIHEFSAKQFVDLFTSKYYSTTTSDFEMVVTDLPNDIDIICLQEVFNKQAWIILNQNLSNAGYTYFLYDSHDQFIKECSPVNWGIYTLEEFWNIPSELIDLKHKSNVFQKFIPAKDKTVASDIINQKRFALVKWERLETNHLGAFSPGNFDIFLRRFRLYASVRLQ